MKRILIAVPVLLIFVVGVLVFAPNFVNWNAYKGQVQEQVQSASGIYLDLKGDFNFSILPFPRLTAEDIHILSADGASDVVQLKRFDVRLDLLPLLGGSISVNSVSLVEPRIYLEQSKEGTLNVMSLLSPPQKNTDKKLEGAEQMNTKAESSGFPAISLEKVSIENGEIDFLNQKTGQKTNLQKINMTLSSKTLTGPFKAQGDFLYGENTFVLKTELPAIDPDAGVSGAKIFASILPYGIDVAYDGAIRFKDGGSLQGILSLDSKDIARAVQSAGGKADTIVSAPLSAKGILTVNADKFMLQDLLVMIGQGKAEGDIFFSLQDQSVSGAIKTIGEIDLETILKSAPFRKVSVDIKFSGKSDEVTLKDSTLNLDGQMISLFGFYTTAIGEKPAYVAAKIEANELDIGRLQKGVQTKENSSTSAPVQTIASSSPTNEKDATAIFPFDFSVQAAVKTLKYEPYILKDVSVDTSLSGRSLKIANFSVGNLENSEISLSGVVQDIENLSGVSVVFDLKTENAKGLVKLAGVDPKTLPEKLNAAKIKAKITGGKDAVDTTANVSALEGDFIFQGSISEPLTSPVLLNLALQVKHPKMAKLIETLTGVEESDPNLQKPLDIYTKITQADKVYTLSEINGNLSGATVQGELKLDVSGAKPDIQGKLVFGDVRFDPQVTSNGKTTPNKASSGSKSPTMSSGSASSGSRWSKEPISTAFLNSCNLNLDVSAQNLKYGVWPLQKPKISLMLKDGTLGIQNLQAKLFEGNIFMNASVQSVQQERQPLHVSGNAKLDNVSLLPLIEALSGSQLVKASGRVSTEVEINSSGISPAALVYDLGGKGTVTGQNIVLDGIDVVRFARALSDDSKPGDTVLGLWKGSTQGGSTAFDTLDGNFTISEGIVNIAKLDLDGKQAAIYTTGKVNLPDWTLATKHKMVAKAEAGVDPAFPPFEVNFSGSLDNPAQTFGQGLLDDYLGRKVQRKLDKLLTDKLGLGGKEPEPAQDSTQSGETVPAEQQTQEQPAQEKNVTPQELDPEEAVKGILKGLLR